MGTPFLAFLTGIKDSSHAFMAVNMVSSAIFSFVIYLIARVVGFNFYYSLFSMLLTMVLFFSPLRFTPYYPVYTDPIFLLLLSLSFFCLIKQRILLAFIFLIIAYPVRESSIFVAFIFLIFSIYLYGYKKETLYKFIVSIFLMISMKYITSYYLNCNGSQVKTVLYWLYFRVTDPKNFISYFAAISMTAAPIWYISKLEILSKIEKVSLFGFIFAALLSFIGGSDSTRIFFSFYPIYFILIISIIRNKGFIFSIICLLGYLATNNVTRKILEPLYYMPSMDESGFFWQFPDHARPEVSLMILCVWFILFMLYNKLCNILKNNNFKKYF